MSDMVERMARAMAEVDANHEIYHQRPYMEWSRAAMAVVVENAERFHDLDGDYYEIDAAHFDEAIK